MNKIIYSLPVLIFCVFGSVAHAQDDFQYNPNVNILSEKVAEPSLANEGINNNYVAPNLDGQNTQVVNPNAAVVAQDQSTDGQINSQVAQQVVEVTFVPPFDKIGDSMFDAMVDRISLVKPSVTLFDMPSLFLTPSEQSLLQEARLGLTTRAPSDYELGQDGENIPRGIREISLGGIVYLSKGDWTVWLNNQKITPSRLPPEILDIKVYKNYIKLKWFDAYTNQIFPIKLRTHQRFNIDSRIFLPGDAQNEAQSQY